MGDEPTLPATDVPLGGRPEVPGYVVGERLGAGGFGEVFAATHAVIGREVAIKVLHHKYTADRDAVARFVAEARAVNKVSHPGIVEIFDFGVLADGRHYCVMEGCAAKRCARTSTRTRACHSRRRCRSCAP